MVVDETFQVYSGPSTTDGDVVFYGTLDGWFKAADEGTPKELYKFHAPSGILGNPMTYKYKATEYVAVLSCVGGRWRVGAIGLAAGRPRRRKPWCGRLTTSLADYTNLGGTLLVFSLQSRDSGPRSGQFGKCGGYRSGLARYYHSNEVSVPVLNPLAHWAGAKSLIKFGASIRRDDPALLRLARGRSWPVVQRWVYRATRRSPTRIWSWLMPTI